MQEQILIQNLLRKKLQDFQAANASFSIRALAKRLGMQPAATNEILKGKRRVSRKVAERIADKLNLDPFERAELLKNFPQKLKRSSKTLPNKTTETLASLKLSADQFSVISNWLHYAILSLMRTPGFQSSESWIAERFGVSKSEVRMTLSRLEAINIIHRDSKGKWVRNPAPLRTTDDIVNLSLRQSHLNDMRMAQEKIMNVPLPLRDFSAYTFPVNPKLLPKAKEMIRKTQAEIAQLLGNETPEEVYKLCVYLFPLTKNKSLGGNL